MLKSVNIILENTKFYNMKLLGFFTCNDSHWSRTSSSSAVQLKPKRYDLRKRHTNYFLYKNTEKTHNIALCLAYNGQNYHGIQWSKSAKTVEGKLLKALFEGEIISAYDYLAPAKINFNRTSRTDKGVSAAKQIVSFRVGSKVLERNDIIDKVNSYLPPDIRVIAFKQVDDSFDSQLSCEARTYSYLLPTYALAPIDELVWENYRISDSVIEFVDKLLQKFIGHHNFFNYSSGYKEEEKFYKRTIYTMQCGQPFVRQNKEYLLIRIKGKSFIYHQIRKMIGMVICIARSFAPLDSIEKSRIPIRWNIPIAPALGLFLDDIHFDEYNKTASECLDWSHYEDDIDAFRQSIIGSIVAADTNSEKNMLSLLKLLPLYKWEVDNPNIRRYTILGEISSAFLQLEVDKYQENSTSS